MAGVGDSQTTEQRVDERGIELYPSSKSNGS